MTFDAPFLDELRLLFMEGATISRLIRQIARQKPEDTSLHQFIQDCFFHAFGVGPLRISRNVSAAQMDDETFFGLNQFLIAEIIERYGDWGAHLSGQSEPFWKGMHVKSGGHLIEKANPDEIPELVDCWKDLDPKAQKYIQRIMGNLNETVQNLEILARLSERLQGQVIDAAAEAAPIKE